MFYIKRGNPYIKTTSKAPIPCSVAIFSKERRRSVAFCPCISTSL